MVLEVEEEVADLVVEEEVPVDLVVTEVAIISESILCLKMYI